MALEIERKFLVAGDNFRHLVFESSRICQAFLVADEGRVVRVRIRGEHATLTIKGPSSAHGLVHHEYEHPIPLDEAEYLLTLCPRPAIDKVRHLVHWGSHLIEIDEFCGANQGLLMAEVELASAQEPFCPPPFLGREVTGDARYYNAYLYHHPYAEWGAHEGANGM